MTLIQWTSGAAVLLLACTPTVDVDSNPADTTAVARFAPDAADPCASVLPFPSDLARDRATGRLNLPFCPTDDAQTIAIKTGLRTLDGYSINTPITARFSAPLDAASLRVGQTVFVINTVTGQPVAAQAFFRPNDDTPATTDDNTLLLVPTAPLAERTTYLVAVTTGVLGADGNPVKSDQAFTLAKSRTPLVDARGVSQTGALDDAQASGLEVLRLAFAPLFAALAAPPLGLTRDRIALAWPFTAQTVHASLPQLAALVTAAPAIVEQDYAVPAALHPLLQSLGLGAGVDCVYTGRVTLNGLAGPSGTFVALPDGALVVTPVVSDYVFTTPRTGTAPGGTSYGCQDFTAPWNGDQVVVFAHGLGRCKNDVLALADTFGAAGWAMLAFDGPRAGSRVPVNRGDSEPDACPDQEATPDLIALPGETPNPFAIRDLMREWGLEILQVANAVKADAWAFTGAAKPAGETTAVAILGHSFGGMAAVLGGSVASDLRGVATNAASGEFGTMLQPLLPSAEVASTFRWALEPGDPLYAAGAWPAATPVLTQIVSGGTGNEALLHATATQTLLGRALGQPLATVTFGMSGAACTSATAVVGALLRPCSGEPAAMSQLVAMRTQILTFLVTGAVP